MHRHDSEGPIIKENSPMAQPLSAASHHTGSNQEPIMEVFG